MGKLSAAHNVAMRISSMQRSNGDSGNIAHQCISKEGKLDYIVMLQYEIERLTNNPLLAKEETRLTDDSDIGRNELKHIDGKTC